MLIIPDSQNGGGAQLHLFIPQILGGRTGQRPAQDDTGGALGQAAQLQQLQYWGAQRGFHIAGEADAVARHRHKGGGLRAALHRGPVQVDHGAGPTQQPAALSAVSLSQLFLHLALGGVFAAHPLDGDAADIAGNGHLAVADVPIDQHRGIGGAQSPGRQPDAARALVPQGQHGAHLAADIRLVIYGINEQHSAAAHGLPQLFRQRSAVGLIHDKICSSIDVHVQYLEGFLPGTAHFLLRFFIQRDRRA